MPATLPAHPAAVLPLKVLSPHRFDGVALVVGSAVPDLAYIVQGLGVEVHSHAWHSLVWFSLPVTLVVAALVRRAAPAVAAHLPAGGPLAIRDYGVLATVRHPLRVTVGSALLGAFSHLAWDTFTHPYILIVHPFLGGDTYLSAMHRTAVAGLPWWRVIQVVSEVLGAVVTLATAIHIGRHRRLVAWHGPAPATARRAALFWSVASGVTAALVAAALALPGNTFSAPNVIGVRLIVAGATGLVAAAAAVGLAARPGRTTSMSRSRMPDRRGRR
jgi:hypothetical protein